MGQNKRSKYWHIAGGGKIFFSNGVWGAGGWWHTVIPYRSECSCCGNCTCPVSKLRTPVPLANMG